MKYIIKNCFNCWSGNKICGCTYNRGGFKDETESYKYCKDISDCLLKRIVEKCKEAPMIDSELSLRILELFEIEEYE